VPALVHSPGEMPDESTVTRVDFYVLAETRPNAAAHLACRLAEKAYGLGRAVHMHVDNEAQARALDDLLWSFRDGSFVPHEVLTGQEAGSPVTVGWQDEPPVTPDVLINLTAAVPGYFSRFERLAEIVEPDQAARSASRERFRFYRERGYPLQTHKL